MRWIGCLLLLAMTHTANAEIYRWLNDNGEVVYSDQPNHSQAEKVTVSPASFYQAPRDWATEDTTTVNEDDSNTIPYNVQIMAPVNDESFWANNGNVQVNVAVDPVLNQQRGDKLVLMLDGQVVEELSSQTSIVLTNLPRGTHSLSAYIVAASGERVSEPYQISFHLHRASALR